MAISRILLRFFAFEPFGFFAGELFDA